MSENWWFPCPVCTKAINILSESGKIGACAKCRDTITPKYIPKEQHTRYIQQYLLERKNELHSMQVL